MFRGYLKVGDTEIANNERTRRLALTAPTLLRWLNQGPKYPTLEAAMSGGVSYDYTNIAQFPWYDNTQPDVSSRFFGLYVMGISGLLDSSRTVQITESVYDGGVLGIPRKATKRTKVQGIMIARGLDALEYGFQWLDAVLDADACGQHGNICGATDLTFLTDVPPAQESGQSDADYQAVITGMTRYLHGVGTTSGPLIDTELESGPFFAYNIEFTLGVTRPYVYSAATDLNIPPTIPIVYQDIPYNLAPYPSLELTDGTTPVVATNYHPNPSLEVDATGWAAAVGSTVSGTAATSYLTSGRSTDIAANRTASFRARVLGDGATAVTGETQIIANSTADLTTPLGTAGTRVSFTAWLAMIVAAGAGGSTLKSMKLDVIWLNSSNAQVGSPVNIGTTTAAADFNGKVMAATSLVPPATAVKAKVQATYDFIWTSSSTPANNSDVRCYIDAVAVTVP